MAKVQQKVRQRLLDNWIETYLAYNAHTEPPEIFHKWCALLALSFALNRKCFINRGHYTTYPNFYIVLMGDPASRKSTAAKIVIRLMKQAQLGPIYEGDATKRALSIYFNKVREESGASQAFIFSTDLVTLLGPDSYASGLAGLLTVLYDCDEEKEYRTATQGTDRFEKAFVNLLGTTPGWSGGMHKSMIEGGLFSRITFVVHEGESTRIMWPKRRAPEGWDKEKRELERHLIIDLMQVATLEGEFEPTEEVIDYLDDWYKNKYSDKEVDTRIQAYYERKAENVLRVAMCLSASKKSNKLIELEDAKQAIDMLEEIEALIGTAYVGAAFGDYAQHNDRVLGFIRKEGGRIAHWKLVKKMNYHIDAENLRKYVINTLIESGDIKIDRGSNGLYYSLKKGKNNGL